LNFTQKKGSDLIGSSVTAPQTGIVQFTGNSANLLTKGIDVILNSTNIRGNLNWTSNFLFNYVKDKVTAYRMPAGQNNLYISANYLNPFVGKPYSSLFAYKWALLDGNGDPQGFKDGELTKDYSSILNSTDINDLKYIGTSQPAIFGSLRNNFEYKNFDLSFNIVYKMGYYFRRGSFISDMNYKQADFDKRWKSPGDEIKTNVPSLIYPFDSSRNAFYAGSEVLVEKGDHIRLQDIRLSYTMARKNLPLKNLKFYAYAANLGLLWRANRLGLDPDYVGNGSYGVANPRSFAIGLSADF